MENTKEESKHFISESKQNEGSKKNKKITKKEQERQYIEWRRSKILELTAQGYTTERELANKLRVSDSTIHKDFVFLREQTRENFKTHIQERLPSEYERCLTGMNQVLKISWDIANNSRGANNEDNNNDQTVAEATVDNKTRLQALTLVNNCYKYIMDLTTNGMVITDAIKFVEHNKENLDKIGKEKETNDLEYNEVIIDDNSKDQKADENTGAREIDNKTINQVF